MYTHRVAVGRGGRGRGRERAREEGEECRLRNKHNISKTLYLSTLGWKDLKYRVCGRRVCFIFYKK